MPWGHADLPFALAVGGSYGLGRLKERDLRRMFRVRSIAALLGALVMCGLGGGCPGQSCDDCQQSDPCGLRVRLVRCGDAYGTGDPADGGGYSPPLVCVEDMLQQVGLGRCTSDEDCRAWAGTPWVPAWAVPPYPRCITFAATGERFCESFEDQPFECSRCEPGYPCVLDNAPSCVVEPWAMNYRDPGDRVCRRQITRDAGVDAPAAHITACVPGTPLYVEEACYAPPPL